MYYDKKQTKKNYLSSVHKAKPYTNIKHYIHKHQTQIFEQTVPSTLPLLKEHMRLEHVGIVDNFNLSTPD